MSNEVKAAIVPPTTAEATGADANQTQIEKALAAVEIKEKEDIEPLAAAESPVNDQAAEGSPGEEPGDAPDKLSTAEKEALSRVRRAFHRCGKAGWDLAFALLDLQQACKAAGHKYLDVAQKHLADLGAKALSPSTITRMVQAADYLRSKGIEVPKDAKTFPTYSHVFPFHRSIASPERAKKVGEELEAIHRRVFDGAPVDRPASDEVRKAVAGLFAPPKPQGDQPPIQGLPPERITTENLSGWFRVAAPDGELTIYRLRVSAMSADALATAIRAHWRELETAKFVRIEVQK